MGGKEFKNLLRLICFLSISLTLAFSSKAQVISPEIYETEEDLKEGLEKGDLTLDEYLELLDLIRSKVDLSTESLSRITSVPDLSLIDIEGIKEESPFLIEDKFSAFREFLKDTKKEWEGELLCQTKEDFEEGGYLENFCRMRFKTQKGFHLGWEGENSDSKDFLTRKRWFGFENSRNTSSFKFLSKIIIGNFECKKGLGINLGYYPYFNSEDSSEEISQNSFLYPTKGRFNGVFFETGFRNTNLDLILSKNKYGRITDGLYAFDLNHQYRNLKMGSLYSKSLLRNSTETLKDECLSFYFDLNSKKLDIISEFATLLNGEGAWAIDLLKKERKFFSEIALWWYSKEFVHPHSGGISNPDYQTIKLTDDFSYRDRRKGERGVLFKSKYYFTPELFFDFSFTGWRKNPDETEKLKTKLGWGYFFSKRLFCQMHYFLSDEIESGGKDYQVISSFVKFWFEKKSYFLLRSNLRFKKQKTKTERYGDLSVKVTTLIFSTLDFTIWLKINDPDFSDSDDGCFKLFLEEKIKLSNDYYLFFYFFKKFYQQKDKEDEKGFRLKLQIKL